MSMSEILGLDDLSGDDAAAILGAMLEGDDLSGDDILGDDILGDDSAAAILGAALQAKGKAGKKLLAKAIASRRLGSSQMLVSKKAGSAGVQCIGFWAGAAGVAAATQAVITTQPQTWFKPQRLVIPDTIAPFFTVDNIIVGNKSQLPSPIPLPGETFVPGAVAVVMDLDTVNPALNLTLMVTNISGVVQNFRATFVGKEVTP
jgi:hypothetical protein